MKLPHVRASASVRVEYGAYVAGRCIRSGNSDLVPLLLGVNGALRDRERALEDLGGPLAFAKAVRDGVEDDLHAVARLARLKLASRTVRAARERPYLTVFPVGIAWYVDAKLQVIGSRYGLLAARAAELAPEDPVRREVEVGVEEHLAAWDEAVKGMEAAREAVALAKTDRGRAVAEWNQALTVVYAALLVRVGKEMAERHFPRAPRRSEEAEID